MTDTGDKERLLGSRFLEAASPRVLSAVAEVLETVRVEADQSIITKGDCGTSMYILADGRVRVHDGEVIFTHLGQGEIFGEMAALDSDIRSASVTAETDCVLYRLEQSSLYRLMSDHTEAAQTIIRTMCRRQRDIVRDIAERTRHLHALERELEIGRQIQASFLPGQLPRESGWEFAAYFRAAREVAGDFYDAFKMDQARRIGIVIGDVCDKGVGAALFMTLFRSLIRANAMAGEFTNASQRSDGHAHRPNQGAGRFDDAEKLLDEKLLDTIMLTNNYIAHTHDQSGMFASLFFALLDPTSGRLSYINGGHEPPVVFNDGGIKERLEPSAPVIGIVADIDISVMHTRLEPGDTLLAFTDGVTEALSADEQRFTEGRLVSLLGRSQSAAELLERIEGTLRTHASGAKQFDDITMLAVRRHTSTTALR